MGHPCAEAMKATDLDGNPVCGVCYAGLPKGLAVQVGGTRGRLTCVDTTEGRLALLEPGVEATRLTDRERQVLEHVARGRTTEQIARRLGISAGTVRTHVEHARDKLGCKTRAQAVLVAWRSGQLG